MNLEDLVKDTLQRVSGNGVQPEPEPTPVEVVKGGSVVVKGEPVRVFERKAVNGLSDIAIDCRNANAIHVQVIVTGTTPSATLSVEGSEEEGGTYIALSGPGASKTGIASNTSFDVHVGSAWAKIRIASISGTFAAGQGYTIICTPYAGGGVDTVNVDQLSKQVTVYNATGTGAIALSSTMARQFRLLAVTVHLSAAPTTSQALTIKLNANDGAAYDTTLLSTDPSQGSVTDIVYIPDGEGMILEGGDEIDVAYTNTDSRTYGVRVVCEAV